MGIEFYVAAVLPALLWGFTPIVSKRAMAHGGNFFQASSTLVGVCLIAYWSALAFRPGGWGIFQKTDPWVVAMFLLGGVVGTTLGRIWAFTGIETVGASLTSAGVSVRPMFSAILAVVLLREPLTLLKGGGIVMVVLGLIVLSRSRGGDIEGWSVRDMIFPLLAALAFGVGGVIRRYGFTISTVTPLEAVSLNELGSLVALGGWGIIEGPDRLRVPLKSYGFMLISAVLTAVALYSMFYALRLGPVIVVDPLTSTAPLFTTFFTYLFLKDLEHVTSGIVLGATGVVIGAVLITLG